MYQIIEAVICSKRYELNDILKKIDTIWVQGDLTDEQREELVELARENADPAQSYAPLQEQVDKAFAAIKALEERVKVLEDGEAPEPVPEPEEWPAWVQPTGAHDAYQTGDKVTYNGKHYPCLSDGNVWSPDAYPAGWQLVEDSEA